MAGDDDDNSWSRQLLLGLGALVAVSLVIGGLVSVLALGAARVSGLGDHSGADAPPSLYLPSDEPTTAPQSLPDPGSTGPSPSPTPPAPTRSPARKPRTITLLASPQQVPTNQRIDLTGSYPRSDGARLQVQRFEGGTWVDFPVDATVRDGSFTTYVYTGRAGPNRFRMVDPASGRTSNPVRVVVR